FADRFRMTDGSKGVLGEVAVGGDDAFSHASRHRNQVAITGRLLHDPKRHFPTPRPAYSGIQRVLGLGGFSCVKSPRSRPRPPETAVAIFRAKAGHWGAGTHDTG